MCVCVYVYERNWIKDQMGVLMQNAALFMPDRGVWHGDCVVALKVYFRGLRLTSVKWDRKTVFC